MGGLFLFVAQMKGNFIAEDKNTRTPQVAWLQETKCCGLFEMKPAGHSNNPGAFGLLHESRFEGSKCQTWCVHVKARNNNVDGEV